MQTDSTPVVNTLEMGFGYQVLDFFQAGGVFMYIILGLLCLGLCIALERFLFLRKRQSENKADWNKLIPLLQKGNHEDLHKQSQGATSIIAKMIAKVKDPQQIDNKADLQSAIQLTFSEQLPSYHIRLAYLPTLANVATLVGLLGTIFGLTSAFAAIGTADPSQKAEMLSSSISVAMNTTAFGLMAAIPLLLINAWIQNKLDGITQELNLAASKIYQFVAKNLNL
jgi:biopolymer transport protein ExbB